MKDVLRIIHAADLHLDSPFQGLGAEKAALRRGEQRELLGRLCALTAEKQADLLLLAGDLLDTGSVYAETAHMLCMALSGLDCPVFIAPGNHDYYSSFSPWARLKLPENVHVFKSARPECVDLPEAGARVWGTAFTDITAEAPLHGFALKKREGVLDIGVFHSEMDHPESRYAPIFKQELAISGLDYAALGHVHSYSGLRRAGPTHYAWPGCAEGRGFDECGEKGALYIELERTGDCRAQLVPLAGRKYEVVTLDIGAGEPELSLPDSGGRDICRLVLTGEADALPDIRRIAEEMNSRFFAFEIQNKTTLSRDIWEKAGEDSLRGLFLRRMRRMYDDAPDDAGREKITQAVRWGLAAMDDGEAVSPL